MIGFPVLPDKDHRGPGLLGNHTCAVPQDDAGFNALLSWYSSEHFHFAVGPTRYAAGPSETLVNRKLGLCLDD